MRPVALLCGDIHLSVKPPVFRSNEPNWFLAMLRGLVQLRDHASELHVPILCAGDIFDKWNGPVEVINFALEHLPEMYAVPGQHDLPYHRYDDIGISAFAVLLKAGKVRLLDPGLGVEPYKAKGGLRVFGFPWGFDLLPCPAPGPGLNIAVIHKYVWLRDEHKHPNASPDSSWQKLRAQLSGYDLSVFGDNHRGFYSPKNKVYNCGTFFRRKADEAQYTPCYGVLYEDGTVERIGLDTSEDIYLEMEKAAQAESRDIDYVKELESLTADPLDFEGILTRSLDGESAEVRKAVLEAGNGK